MMQTDEDTHTLTDTSTRTYIHQQTDTLAYNTYIQTHKLKKETERREEKVHIAHTAGMQ